MRVLLPAQERRSTSMNLVDDGYRFKKIMDGRKWVGRVTRHASEPVYLGTIGKLTVRAATEREAFEEVVAQHWGYANAAELKRRNSAIRARNSVRRAESRAIANQMVRGDFDQFLNLMDRVLKSERE
jgi:hypothetical protein